MASSTDRNLNNLALGSINILGTMCEYGEKYVKDGISFVVLTKNGRKQFKNGAHPYQKNINRGSNYTKSEMDILSSGAKGPKNQKATDNMNKLFSDAKAAYPQYVNVFPKKIGLGVLSLKSTWSRKYNETYQPTSLADCKSPSGPAWDAVKATAKNNTQRSCTSLHAVGRAADIMNECKGKSGKAIGTTKNYSYFDINVPETANSGVYLLWKYFADNAHKYEICGISNEWWHWQYFGDATGSDEDGDGDTSGSNGTSYNGGSPTITQQPQVQQESLLAIFSALEINSSGKVASKAVADGKVVEKKTDKTKDGNVQKVIDPSFVDKTPKS